MESMKLHPSSGLSLNPLFVGCSHGHMTKFICKTIQIHRLYTTALNTAPHLRNGLHFNFWITFNRDTSAHEYPSFISTRALFSSIRQIITNRRNHMIVSGPCVCYVWISGTISLWYALVHEHIHVHSFQIKKRPFHWHLHLLLFNVSFVQ